IPSSRLGGKPQTNRVARPEQCHPPDSALPRRYCRQLDHHPKIRALGMEFPRSGRVYISPKVPYNRLYYVVAHEYAHARAYKNWGRNQKAADAAMNRWFGGGIHRAREVAADCMAIAQGATWTGYSRCKSARWRAGAKTLLAGK